MSVKKVAFSSSCFNFDGVIKHAHDFPEFLDGVGVGFSMLCGADGFGTKTGVRGTFPFMIDDEITDFEFHGFCSFLVFCRRVRRGGTVPAGFRRRVSRDGTGAGGLIAAWGHAGLLRAA